MIRGGFVLCMKMLLILVLSAASNPAPAQGAYEVRHDTLSASGWFGGDDRLGGNHRSVGVGQEVLVESAITLKSFAFHFSAHFDYSAKPDFAGHEVTLKLHVRDSTGQILKTDSVIVPASFDGGWVAWSNLGMTVPAHTRLIFTSYLVGASTTHQYNSGQSADQFSLYLPGGRYVKEDTTDTTMDSWIDWLPVSWDSAFLLEGVLQTTGVVERTETAPLEFALEQNYPNPFNPATVVSWQLSGASNVKLVIYDMLGQEVTTLVDEVKEPGTYKVTWDASRCASGVYIYRLTAGEYRASRTMVLLR